ncbi:hypothetical protein EDB89DRAFT_1907717 [Lactarius sanguifluus]|nr:hypothetical protein EDB89DRAFT_1907717 [Lactarius sanguifluus]
MTVFKAVYEGSGIGWKGTEQSGVTRNETEQSRRVWNKVESGWDGMEWNDVESGEVVQLVSHSLKVQHRSCAGGVMREWGVVALVSLVAVAFTVAAQVPHGAVVACVIDTRDLAPTALDVYCSGWGGLWAYGGVSMRWCRTSVMGTPTDTATSVLSRMLAMYARDVNELLSNESTHECDSFVMSTCALYTISPSEWSLRLLIVIVVVGSGGGVTITRIVLHYARWFFVFSPRDSSLSDALQGSGCRAGGSGRLAKRKANFTLENKHASKVICAGTAELAA